MLAYPTPTFDAKTILQAPGYRPLAKGGQTIPSEEPVAITPAVKVNKHTANGGFVGSRARNFIQNNQFLNPKYDPMKGTPLSKVGSVGNVGDQFISAGRPFMAEPKNEELRLIMNILDGKPIAEEKKGKLTAKQVRAMGEKSMKLNEKPKGEMGIIDDLKDSQDALKEANRIKNAMAQGFTYKEAKGAYDRLREKEAEKALFQQQDTSVRLYDLIDSRVGGDPNPLVPGNDESALGLALGRNRDLVSRAEARDARNDKAVKFDTTPDLLTFPKKTKAKSVLEEPLSALESMVDKSIREPKLSITPLGMSVLDTLASADISIFKPKKKGGRPKGRGDTQPRSRRTKAELELAKKQSGL